MAGTRWAAQVAFTVGVLVLLAPAALWVALLGPFYRRHHPLPSAARRRAVEARLEALGWLGGSSGGSSDSCPAQSLLSLSSLPVKRGLELALVTEAEAGGVVCDWDWAWLQEQLAPALAHLRPLVHLTPVTARLVPPAAVLPPGLLPPGGEMLLPGAVPAIPTSALGTLSGHLDEAVLGAPPVPFATDDGQPPLRLVVACRPLGAGGRGTLSFVEDGKGSGASAAAAAAESVAVTIDGWGGLLLLSSAQQGAGDGVATRLRLSEAAHEEVVAFVVSALRRWVLGKEEKAGAGRSSSSSSSSSSSHVTPLSRAEMEALVASLTRARAHEALWRLRVLQEEVVGKERPPLTPVPGSVARNFERAVASLEHMASDAEAEGAGAAAPNATGFSSFAPLLLGHASAALAAAHAAGADPGLLAPPHLAFEHYAAVLLPLLLPVLLPLLVGLGKERRRLREKRGALAGHGRKAE